jgi:uncharacterized protein YdeI (BOF family)
MKKKFITALIMVFLFGVLLYGFWSYTQQSKEKSGELIFGRVDQPFKSVPISSLLSGEKTKDVTIEGKVVSMGSTMGCWLVIDDGSGEIMVQTDPMIYIPQEIQNQPIRATGSLFILNGGMGFKGETLALMTSGITILEE